MSKLDALWRYQLADQEYDALENQLKNSKARQSMFKIRKYLIDQQEKLLKMEADIEQKHTRLEELTAMFEEQNDLYTKLEAEFKDAVKDDLDSVNELLNKYTKVQGDIVLIRRELYIIMQDVKSTESRLQDMKSKISKARKDFSKFKEEHTKELEGASEELGKLQAAVVEAGKEVDKALIERYNNIKKNKITPLAMLENGQCGGCNMTLPSLMITQVQESDEIFECENCGRILFVADVE